MTYDKAMQKKVALRTTDDRIYFLNDWPTETQKLINKMNVLDDGWKKDRPSFIEAYDDKGGIHMVNTMYVIEVYVVEHVLIKGVDQILEGVDFE